MSKISDAMDRIREIQRDSDKPPLRNRRRADRTDTHDPTGDTWTGLRLVELDQDLLERNRILTAESDRAAAEMSYKMLRTRMIRRMRDNGWSSVVVTSAETGAGKSVTAINLAISVALESNQTAYLVDLDLRQSSLHTYLGVEPPAGDLTAYLEGRCGLHDVLVDAGIPRLYFAFNSIPQQHSAELLSSTRMRDFVAELHTKDPNGLIIYDAPPLLVADDVLAFLPNFDAVLMVVAEGQTSREDLNKCIDMLSEVEVLGLVLNKSHSANRKSAYY